MATSRTHLANQALRHIGVSKTLANVDAVSDRSAGATACRDFLDSTLDEVLRDFDWPFARRVTDAAGLALVAEQPTSEWLYSYRLPADLLAIRKVHNGTGIRADSATTRALYALHADTDGLLLYSDHESTSANPLQLVYTARVDIARWPADVAQAAALLLASYIAPSITEGDELKMGERAMAKYAYRMEQAKVTAANEGQPDATPDGDFLAARI